MAEPGQQKTLWIVATAGLLATSLWFAGTAAIPQLTEAWGTDLSVSAWLTMAVQLGFVAGALLVAVFNLPDVFRASRVYVVSAIAAAAANAAFALWAEQSITLALVTRFFVGVFLAGVYPVGMKILAGWFRGGRGTALGILVGALTVGTALPFAVKGAEIEWQAVAYTCSGLALLAALLVGLWVEDGPYTAASPPFDLGQVGEAFRNRRLRLANLGYFGHMWELYSMWGWIALMLAASAGENNATISIAAFVVIASGAIGCVWAGKVADRNLSIGNNNQGSQDARAKPLFQTEEGIKSEQIARRARVTIVAMAVSGVCCLVVPLVFEWFWALVAVSFVWGVAVVADSAQFSAIVSEVADPRYIGTALALQTAIGFLLTVVSIRVIGAIGAEYGWGWAAAAMSVGPMMGIVAMTGLARRPAN